MEGPNIYIPFLAALIPLAIGAFYYSPMLFQNSWMSASGMTEEKMKTGNMALIFALTYIFSLLIAGFMTSFSIHQSNIPALFVGVEKYGISEVDAKAFIESFQTNYGHLHRTFSHGATHGGVAAIFFALPLIAINALFERKSWKYILIHTGYWFISLALMGGLICAYF